MKIETVYQTQLLDAAMMRCMKELLPCYIAVALQYCICLRTGMQSDEDQEKDGRGTRFGATEQLTAVQDHNTNMNRDFDQAVQRERMAQDRIAALERELAAERAQSDERLSELAGPRR